MKGGVISGKEIGTKRYTRSEFILDWGQSLLLSSVAWAMDLASEVTLREWSI